MSDAPIIIIGTGLAGYNLAREFRKKDNSTRLVLISKDNGEFYSKPMLSNALAKQKAPDDLPMGDAAKMQTDLNARIIYQQTVSSIDSQSQNVVMEEGETLAYKKLVLAVGASPFQFPMQGDATGDVLTVNNLDDYRVFRKKLENKKSVAIIGPGLIGCEFANDLAANDYQVSVIGPDEAPISTLLPTQAGLVLQEALSAIGVNWYLQKTVSAVNKNDAAYELTLSDGQTIKADVVLSAIGLRANINLAKETGIVCNRGIVVDRFLKTSNENIYALGDCAEVEGMLLPFVMPLMQSARALAVILGGGDVAVSYPAMPVLIKTPILSTVVSPPASGAEGEWHIEKSSQGVKALFTQGEALLGFVLMGDAVSEKPTLTRLLPAVLV